MNQRLSEAGRKGAYIMHGEGKTNTLPARRAFRDKFSERAAEAASNAGERISEAEAVRRGELLWNAHWAEMRRRKAEKREAALAA